MTGANYGIVAGYDGSPGSDQALRWAVREARARDTTLTVCLAWAPGQIALPADSPVYGLMRQYGQEILDRGLFYAESALGPGRVLPALADGLAAEVLCERSRTSELVVVGARGTCELPHLLLGSVCWQVAGHANGRVVAVRGQWRPDNQAPGPVVAGLDGSPASLAALAFAFEEATLRGVPLVVVCASADAAGRRGETAQLEEDFEHLMTVAEKEHPEVTVQRCVVAGTPRAGLLTAAHGAQLLVVGARGRGGVAGMRLGAVAQAVLHHAPGPVAIVHADPADDLP
jgi:nucleotide-binding universal stress UspA family protein